MKINAILIPLFAIAVIISLLIYMFQGMPAFDYSIYEVKGGLHGN
jgi:hypothetical protein